MNLYAPVLKLEKFGPENMLSALKAECEHVIHLPGKKFNFQVQFSENEDFNAAAYEAGGKAYINMSIATVMQLYHHILLLMGREELLPGAGKEEMFDGRYRIEEFQLPEICRYDEQYRQIVFYSGPDNPKRSRIAELITLFGMEFLMFHELGHHIGGHLRYLSDKLGLNELYAQGNSALEDARIYQMLETDADVVAVTTLLESIYTKIDFYKEEFLFGMGELIPHCIIIAVTTAFFLMEREGYAYNIGNARYLPRDVRFQLVFYIYMDQIKGDYNICRFSQSREEIIETFVICNDLLSELYLEKDADRKIVFCMSDEIKKYYDETLIPVWKKMRSELLPYAVIHLPE